MSIYHLLDWRWINLVTPFLGLASCAFLLLSSKTCTRRMAVSTAISLSIMFWLMLTWADWGSAVFVASYQTMWARVLLLIISILVAHELKHYTRLIRSISSRNARLELEKKQLRAVIYKLESQLTTNKDEIQ